MQVREKIVSSGLSTLRGLLHLSLTVLATYSSDPNEQRIPCSPERNKSCGIEQTTLVNSNADVFEHLNVYLLEGSGRPKLSAYDEDRRLTEKRGIKPKRNGQGRRGGYNEEQVLTHLKAVADVAYLWIVIENQRTYKSRRKCSIDSRAFVITDRVGTPRLNFSRCGRDEYMDVVEFKYALGRPLGSSCSKIVRRRYFRRSH